MSVLMKLVPSYEKVFFDGDMMKMVSAEGGASLRGEPHRFLLVATSDDSSGRLTEYRTLTAVSPLAVGLERVEQVPVRVPAYPTRVDGDYLDTKAGLYPDLLLPMESGDQLEVPCHHLVSVYVTVDIPEGTAAGEYPVTLTLEQGEEKVSATYTVKVLDAVLPRQTLIYTEWIHYDCIADYYGVEVFSKEHWAYIENYLRCAVKNGINTILTPVFTPPLDTAVGGERPTVQLVGVEKTAEGYLFDFTRFCRFVDLCRRCGAEYFEISHFFTQWGAEHAPKIVATVDGEEKRIFGWETDSLSEEYIGFLRQFLTALLEEIKTLGIEKRVFFHISDEPQERHLARYLAVKEKIIDLLSGYPVMDALSNIEFYKLGAVANPIPATDRIEPFLTEGIEGLWTYYCCAQTVDVSNRFIAMPASRTRIIGAQLWKYRITGFLHWGYNFWYSQYSKRRVDPFLLTDGAFFAPAGDCCSVYPAPEGMPYESLHMRAFTEALDDLRVFALAETLCGREAVLSAVEAAGEITFSSYPRERDSAHMVRMRVNTLIEGALKV